MGLVVCLWCLTTCPDIQLSSMPIGHVAEVKYLLFRCKVIYIHLFHCTIKTPKRHWTLKCQRYPICMLTVPQSSKFHSAFLYEQMFSSYRLFWDKCTKWRQMTLNTKRSKVPVSNFNHMRVDLRNCHILAWNLASGKSSRNCTYTVFLSYAFKIKLIFALRAADSDICADFPNCHIWAWNLAKVPGVAHLLSLHPLSNWNSRVYHSLISPRIALHHQPFSS